MEFKDLRWLINTKIKNVSFDSASETWYIHFSNDAILSIHCLWRLIEVPDLCSTSKDHGHKFGNENAFDGQKVLNEMSQYEINKIEIGRGTGDIQFTLGELFILQVIQDSAGYEGWQIKDKNGNLLVSQGGEIHHIQDAKEK